MDDWMDGKLVLDLNSRAIFELLSDEEAGAVIKALFRYVMEGINNFTQLDEPVQIALLGLKSQVERIVEEEE